MCITIITKKKKKEEQSEECSVGVSFSTYALHLNPDKSGGQDI